MNGTCAGILDPQAEEKNLTGCFPVRPIPVIDSTVGLVVPTIVTAALLAVIVGALFFLRSSPASAAAAPSMSGANGLNNINSNPLFEGRGNEMNNPLFEGRSE